MFGLLRYMFLVTFAVGSSLVFAQDSSDKGPANELASLLVSDDLLSRFLDAMVSVVPDVPVPNASTVAERQQIAVVVRELGKQYLAKAQVQVLQRPTQATLEAEFSDVELQTLMTFYKTDLGRKWLKTQPALTASLAKSIAVQISNSIIDDKARQELEGLRKSLDAASLEELDKAIAADAVPLDLLCQHWYELNEGDPDVTYYNLIKRELDGSCAFNGVVVDKSEKIYARYSGRSRWTLMGRAFMETLIGDDSVSSVYIIDELSKDKMVSRLVAEDTPSAEWEMLTETTRKIAAPSVPDGYSIEDETESPE
mgnify:FL=1